MYSITAARTSSPLITVMFVLFSALSSTLHASVEKSPIDTKQYAAITLDNQMRVLLISNPSTDKAAASMNVAVGSSANPKDRAGLAHFLEHMLFLGTEKYPQADEYQSYIRSHGGGHNAYTSQENTNYFFDVTADSLEPTLDRFAQFFISPLFNEKYVDRERHAVHSEYKAKIKDDYRRSYAVTKRIMNPENSHNWFSVGNLETLSNNDDRKVRKDLIAFYNQYYSANIMTLVVLGKESLTQLEEMVRSKFSAVQNRQATTFETAAPLFVPGQLPQQLNIQTVKDIRSLTLTFPTLESRSKWQKKPLYYISSLIGYEGKGSLLSLLKNKGWVTSLSASQGHNLSSEASFMVNIQLTEDGEKHYLEVAQALFQYVELMKQKGVLKSLYLEEKQLSNIGFRFQEQAEPIHLVSTLSSQMQHYPTEQAISADYQFEAFDSALIQRYLNSIRPDNMLLSLKSNKPQSAATEPFYNVPYEVKALSQSDLEKLAVTEISAELSIRESNPFIASNLELIKQHAQSKIPVQIDNEDGFSLWHKSETAFNIPQADLYFSIQTPVANNSAKNWVLSKLYTEMLQEQLNETLYDAYLAGLSTQIYPHLKGFTVRLSGYNDKLDLLLQDVIYAIQHPEFKEDRFQIFKQKYIDRLANSLKDKPYNQTTSRLYELLLPQWNNQSQKQALSNLNLNALTQFADILLATPSIKVLTHGNLSKEQALSMGDTLKTALLKEGSLPSPSVKVTQIPKDRKLQETLAINHNDSAISLLLQGENNSVKTRAELSLLSEILSAPFYNEIRTEKQLGYIVFATPLQMNKTPAIAFIIQSPVKNADELENEVDSFIGDWNNKIQKITPSELRQYKRSVISRITKKDNKLSSRTQRYWRELDWGDTTFNTRIKLANSVENISLDELAHCLDQLQTRRLSVRNSGTPFLQGQPKINDETESLFSQLKSRGIHVPDV